MHETGSRCCDPILQADQLYVTPVMLGELREGFLKGTRIKENERILEEFLDSPRVQQLVLDDESARCYAAIKDALRRAGTPVSINDVWIAASAMQYGLTILTADSDF